jgi:hypothetical protein
MIQQHDAFFGLCPLNGEPESKGRHSSDKPDKVTFHGSGGRLIPPEFRNCILAALSTRWRVHRHRAYFPAMHVSLGRFNRALSLEIRTWESRRYPSDLPQSDGRGTLQVPYPFSF